MTFHLRMRRDRYLGLAGALLLASLAGIARAEGTTVWAVAGERNTVYLAGSVHALPREESHLSPELELAYAASDVLVMEVDLDDLDPFEAVQFVSEHGTLPERQTLADVIGSRRYADVVRLAQSVDLPELAIAKLEPWAAAMVLTQFALLKTGYDPQLGIDVQLSERARNDGKPIEGLETIVDQLGVFDARSMREQTRFLLDAADEVPQLKSELARLIRAWRAGDMRGLEKEFRQERAHAPALYDQLLGARNRKWLPQIQALLTEERNYLVVVGALHFVGRDGLLRLLERAGHEPVPLPGNPVSATR